MTDFRHGRPLFGPSPICEQPQKIGLMHLNRVNAFDDFSQTGYADYKMPNATRDRVKKLDRSTKSVKNIVS